MKNKIFHTVLFVLMQSLICTSLFSQETLSLNFQGVLQDIEQNVIQDDHFELIVNVLSDPAGTTLWEHTYQASTDENGWFGFEIKDFYQLFEDNPEESATLSLHLGMFPTPDSRWIEQGNDFLVSYKITRVIRNDSLLFEITRMEGSKLVISQFNDVICFNDTYPFAYLQGGFLLSVDRTTDNLSSLRSIIKGDAASSEEAAKSRGVKGGFAVGGYRKNN